MRAESSGGADSARELGRYELLERLGSGGMGAVYRARDEGSGREVALKRLSTSFGGDKRRKFELLFEREYHTLVRLKHPRIIEVYDYGLSPSGPYYTMELLEHEDLHSLAPLPYKEACRHLRDVASSLALIHAHRLLHRDVSPRNVRLTRDGRAKLIDFGALCAFGTANEVVGTPTCLAPEALGRMQLDARTDLYALGVVGYFILTGQHAYPARHFDDLPKLWQLPPSPPSALVSDIPPALDSLIMALINPDPLARPASAAVVIEQLTMIGGLAPEPQEFAAESYLASGAMVGRADERDWVQKRVTRVLAGQGAEVLIEGAPGSGKTRLLHELGLEAQLKGLCVLKTDAEAAPGFFGVAAALSSSLLSTCPEPARRAARPHVALLAELSPALREQLEHDAQPLLVLDPAEKRARLQTALHEWFLEVARERPLLLAVDNAHAADDNSAAFLAALGSKAHVSQLMLLVTQRRGDPVVARSALHTIRKRGSSLTLAGLSAQACEQLVTSMFGDVDNSGRVARLLYDRSAGNPQHCMDLARLMVRKGIVKYAGGTFILPQQVAPGELPSRLEDILSVKLAGLSRAARGLAEVLCVHEQALPIDLCLTLSDEDERTSYAALDELLAEQILLLQDHSYRFAQESLRAALLEQLDAERRRELHLHAAESLLSAPNDALHARMDAAWHLLHAGKDMRAADLLASTSRAFLKSQGGATASVDHLVEALRTAVEVYERHGRSDYEIARLLFPLVPLGYFSSDFHLVKDFGERAIRLGLKITGLDLAQRLCPKLGKKKALEFGLSVASRRFARHQKQGLQLELREAIAQLCSVVPATMAAFSSSFDARGVARIRALLEPLALFEEGEFAALMHTWSINVAFLGRGQARASRLGYERMTERFEDPSVRTVLGDGHFKSMFGGLLYGQAIMAAYAALPHVPALATRMETLGVRTWAMNADQARLLHHAYRGEIEQMRVYRERVELFAIQGCATWQAELFLPAILLNTDVLTGDTIAARRTWEQVSRRAQDVPTLQAYADLAHAAYLTLRGDLDAAIWAFERVLPEFPRGHRVLWLAMRGYFGNALNLAGEHERAKELLTQALTHPDAELDVLALNLEPQRQLALAEAGLGNHTEAARQLDALLAEHGRHDNPLLVGLLHKARAELALLQADKVAFERHLSSMEQRFRGTKNPALIRQCEAIAERAARNGLRPAYEPDLNRARAVARLQKHARTGMRSVAELTIAPDRAEYALSLIMERSGASAGFLYLRDPNGLRLAAASEPHEPPHELEIELRRLCGAGAWRGEFVAQGHSLVHVRAERPRIEPTPAPLSREAEPLVDERGDERTMFIPSTPPAAIARSYRVIVLSSTHRQPPCVVGGVTLDVSMGYVELDRDLIDVVARALLDECGLSELELSR